MKVKWSALGVTEGRGKAGGNVLSRNRGGAYLRKHTMPNNPQTNSQQAIRARFSVFAGQWRGLTEAQRQTWREMAYEYPKTNSVGDSVTSQGNALYQGLNSVIASALETSREPNGVDVPGLPNFAPLLTCPSPVSFPDPGSPEIAITSVGSAVTALTLTGALAPGDKVGFFLLQVWATAPMSAGINSPNKSLFKLVAGFEIDDNPNLAFEVLPRYAELFGAQAPSTTSVAFVEYRYVTNIGTFITLNRQRLGINTATA